MMHKKNPKRPGNGKAIYLFCLARADTPKRIDGLGIDGRSPLSLWRRDAIVAVFSRVSRTDFHGPAEEEPLEDLAWLGPRAQHHAKVIMNMMRYSPVLPTRFGTLFSSLQQLEKLMEKHQEKVLRFFDHVEAREEWVVKAWMKRTEIRAALLSRAQEAQEHPPAASPEARHLHEQRLRMSVEKEINVRARDLCKQVAADLARYASDFRDRPIQPAYKSDEEGDMIANWAFLVRCTERAAFHERIKEANAVHGPVGVCFECSGPWPPCSFVPSLEADPDA